MRSVFEFQILGRSHRASVLVLGVAYGWGNVLVAGGVYGCGASVSQNPYRSDSSPKAGSTSPESESRRSDQIPVPDDDLRAEGTTAGEESISESANESSVDHLSDMTSVRPTIHEAALKKLGLDPLHLPRMESLTPAQRYQVMDLISSSLGVECDSCHQDKNFKKETPQKELARFMWNEMTATFRLAEGALFCDSCHQNGELHLKREDRPQVESYMRAEFVGKLFKQSVSTAPNLGPVQCETCHGEPFVAEIFEQPWTSL